MLMISSQWITAFRECNMCHNFPNTNYDIDSLVSSQLCHVAVPILSWMYFHYHMVVALKWQKKHLPAYNIVHVDHHSSMLNLFYDGLFLCTTKFLCLITDLVWLYKQIHTKVIYNMWPDLHTQETRITIKCILLSLNYNFR